MPQLTARNVVSAAESERRRAPRRRLDQAARKESERRRVLRRRSDQFELAAPVVIERTVDFGQARNEAVVAPERVQCASCAGDQVRPHLVIGSDALLECESCGLVFSQAVPGVGELSALYSADYFTKGGRGYVDYVKDEQAHRQQARRYLSRLTRAGARGGRLLDVGCAAGFFLDEARRAGWDVAGCEVSEYAAGFARERLGLDVQCASFTDTDFSPASFDVISFINVLEHLPGPVSVEEHVARLLKPGGRIIIETWDRDSLVARRLGKRWHQYSPRFVVSYFNRRSLESLFSPARWRLASYRKVAKWITLERGFSILRDLARAGIWSRLMDRLARSAVGRLAVPYKLGDLVWVVFERR